MIIIGSSTPISYSALAQNAIKAESAAAAAVDHAISPPAHVLKMLIAVTLAKERSRHLLNSSSLDCPSSDVGY